MTTDDSTPLRLYCDHNTYVVARSPIDAVHVEYEPDVPNEGQVDRRASWYEPVPDDAVVTCRDSDDVVRAKTAREWVAGGRRVVAWVQS